MRAVNNPPDLIPTIKTGLFGLLGLSGATVLLSTSASGLDPAFGVLVMVGMTALPMIVYDTFALRAPAHPSSGLSLGQNRLRAVDHRRCLIKALGFAGTLLAVAIAYWLFPEYQKDFYQPFFGMCGVILPFCLLLAYPYIVWVDRRMAEPEDGYWHFGLAMTGAWRRVDLSYIKAHLLAWTVKGFFLPLMAVFLMQDIRYLQNNPLVLSSFPLFFKWTHNFLFVVDLAFACVGYALTLRIFNSHIRTTEPTALGWASALACYQPFWAALQRMYFDYRGQTWSSWLEGHSLLYPLWGTAILIALSIYSLATVCFGLRFSNLTHRGIIDFGPYSITKHPAYVAKLCHHFLVGIPFVASGWMDGTRQCLLFGMVALIYFVRAKTEERHLSWDPTYRQYAETVRKRQRRIFSKLLGFMRVLKKN